ncbi:unnamed protein product [Miscanthus lutarioriparius]|uniref:Bifunctional inhibitor/plant lipid transfer protein/seed storage helical domain-containing protein n=1 Tax=Miscanthus lutarioriparius TaxID=422564 RepID=A0A811N2P6_9POAL|nr:unnamed protein product [Miscanthus lutarioriparius]
MDYISGNGTSAPSASCCSQLKSVVQSKPQCLCAALGSDGASTSLGGVTIDRSRALALPAACNVQTPPASQCNGSSGGGSKATPSLPSGGASLRGRRVLCSGSPRLRFTPWQLRERCDSGCVALRRVSFRFSERTGRMLSGLCVYGLSHS